MICIAPEPEVRLCEVAARVGITDRAAPHIVADLAERDCLSSQIGLWVGMASRGRFPLLEMTWPSSIPISGNEPFFPLSGIRGRKDKAGISQQTGRTGGAESSLVQIGGVGGENLVGSIEGQVEDGRGGKEPRSVTAPFVGLTLSRSPLISYRPL